MILLGLLIIFLQINLVENTPRRSTSLDCTRRNSDGLYGRGCSSKFLRCHKGKRFVYICPNNLKFNVETAKCEQRQQIIACLNNMDNDKVIVKADDPFDCSKRKDGVYGSGKCSTTYYHCSRGHSAEMLCPANLYYNDKLKACDEIDSVDECNLLTALRGFDERRESHLGGRGKYIERNLMSNRGGSMFDVNSGYDGDAGTRRLSLGKEKVENHDDKNKRRPARQATYQASSWVPGSKMNCTGLKDGNYPIVKNKCSKYFWRCSGDEITGRVCRTGLFFNKITGKCDTANNITDCANKKKTLVLRSAIESHCNISNGDLVESSPCSKFYYNCTAGKFSSCPKNKVYNSRQKRCDYDFSVPECATAENLLSSAAGNSIQISKIISAPELSDFCRKSGNGIFSAGCENYFYFCSFGIGYHVFCPEGLIFDSETKSCNHQEYVRLCNLPSEYLEPVTNGYINIPGLVYEDDESDEMDIYNIQTKELQHKQPEPEETLPVVISVPISAKALPFLPDDFECKQKLDGFHSLGCKKEFIACANQKMHFFECPKNLMFHENAQLCDYMGNIEDCSDNDKEESFLITDPEIDWEIASEEKIEQTDDDPVIDGHNFCGNLNDGIYFNDCGDEYLICDRGVTFGYPCPKGQIVDPKSKTCNKSENIPECTNGYK